MAEFKAIHKKIVSLLNKKDDDFLLEIVDFRKYNYRFLLNGMIEHNIYHLGQIAYLNKMLPCYTRKVVLPGIEELFIFSVWLCTVLTSGRRPLF
ncbi:MAG: hypothetical protein V9F01_17375 [Chitinophagaceae bacterium]